ncbi:thiol-disulfide isomerase/thioredoxin [Microbacterium keratanolyticum]|uniref:Thioredoxin domain-containing protein n=1 Tax=Microbacterium keratanolyticum TaxID=67574 RepID=A0A9W6HTR7_9MICO|nr:thioredoxin family protein [Microbacterium keratanolyticum]MBM7467750.1 thiol-disulfide isomerase/thioredoxin [Microbacterium keratanolyticum]GLK02741.1 hypothetical protein GCM10017596_24560 [Microbacterium keratanolyticum]
MPVTTALLVAGALLVAATAIGLLWRARQGRMRVVDHERMDVADLAAHERGDRVTIVQFGTEFCARCPQVRRSLTEIAAQHPDVSHVDIDLTHRPDLATRYRVLQTPTTLLVDGDGRIRARFGGVPHRGEFTEALAAV